MVAMNITKKRIKQNKAVDVLALIILIIIAIAIILTVKNYLSLVGVSFVTVHQGTLEDTVFARAIVLRHETLITAPAIGEFVAFIEEGSRVKSGTQIGTIVNGDGGKTDVYAMNAGVVSYQLDGYEEKLRADSLEGLDYNKLITLFPNKSSPLPNDSTSTTSQTLLAKGRPIARIVDNLLNYRLFMLADIPTEKAESLQNVGQVGFTVGKNLSGDTATTEGKEESEQKMRFDATVTDRGMIDGQNYLILDTSLDEATLINLRFFEATLSLRQLNGTIIPKSALTKDAEGKDGVYYKVKNVLRFLPVELKGVIGDEAVVNGLDNVLEVAADASGLKEGQHVR